MPETELPDAHFQNDFLGGGIIEEMGETSIEEWSQKFVAKDLERTAEIEKLSDHFKGQERTIDELRKNHNELSLDGLQIEQKITEDQDLSQIAFGMGRRNELLLIEIQEKTKLGHRSLEVLSVYEKTAKRLYEMKLAVVAENLEKFKELNELLQVLKAYTSKCYAEVTELRRQFVNSSEKKSAQVETAMTETKAFILKLIDSKQLDGLDLSGTESITEQLEKAVNWETENNKRLKQWTRSQRAKKKSLDQKIANFLKEMEQKTFEGEKIEEEVTHLITQEELEMSENKLMEDAYAKNFEMLTLSREQIEKKKKESIELEETTVGNETIIGKMISKMDEEKKKFEATKHNLEQKVTEINEQVMQGKLEGFLMEGRLQELRNQLQKSEKDNQASIDVVKDLESVLQSSDKEVKEYEKNYQNEVLNNEKNNDIVNEAVLTLEFEIAANKREIENEQKTLQGVRDEIGKTEYEMNKLKDLNFKSKKYLEFEERDFENLGLEIEGLKKSREDLGKVFAILESYQEAYNQNEQLQLEAKTNCDRISHEIDQVEDENRTKLKEFADSINHLKWTIKKLQTEFENSEALYQANVLESGKIKQETLKLVQFLPQINKELTELQKEHAGIQKVKPVVLRKNQPRGRAPKKAKISVQNSDWEALIRDCAPIKAEPMDAADVPVKKKFFKTRQAQVKRSAVSSTTGQAPVGDVFDYGSDDDIQIVKVITK